MSLTDIMSTNKIFIFYTEKKVLWENFAILFVGSFFSEMEFPDIMSKGKTIN